MVIEKYVKAYQDFVKTELALTEQYNGHEYAKRKAPYYQSMFAHISQNPDEYIIFFGE